MADLRIQTARFGEITIDSERVLQFVEPLLGFPASTEYTLLDHTENSPFKWLQSLQEPELAFVVSNPELFGIPYEFTISDNYIDKLGIKQAEETIVLTIVNIPASNPTEMTANLLGPLVINQTNRKMMQVVLADSSYSTKTRLLPDTEPQAPEASRPTAKSSGPSPKNPS